MTSESTPNAVAPPAGNPRFPAVDGLRAVAAIAVVIFHADQFTKASHTSVGRIFAHGDLGVTVFFLITGFLLYRPIVAAAVGQAPSTPLKTFYLRRILRIVPAYWLALLVLMPLIQYAHPAGLANIFFLQIYRPSWARSGIPPAWSVCVEMSFYLLLPWYGAALQRRWRMQPLRHRYRRELTLLVVLAIGSLGFRELVSIGHASKYITDLLPGTLAWFCVGMYLAVISTEPHLGTKLWRIANSPWVCWVTAGIIYAAMTVATLEGPEESVFIFAAYGLIAALILLPIVLGRPFVGERRLQGGIAAWLGLISYGIYLYHYPIEEHIHIHAGTTTEDFLCLALVGVITAVICGALSYYLVERYVLSLKNTSFFVRSRAAADQKV